MSNSNPEPENRTYVYDEVADFGEYGPIWDDLEPDIPCPACHGTGIEDGDLYDPDEVPCLDCGGWGSI